MSQNATPASQASTQAEKKPNLRWRVNEIVIAAVIAVACAVIFWIWDIAVGPAAKTALVAAPEFRPIVAGAWLLGGTLGGLLIRKPGAALFGEIVAAFISVLFTGGAWSGEILIAGFFQGVGAEIAGTQPSPSSPVRSAACSWALTKSSSTTPTWNRSRQSST